MASEQPAGVHVHRVPVRFGDCDPAGIVYFPRFFHFFHEAMETWFGDALGLPYAGLIGPRKIGFPAVHTEADFKIPCKLGESIDIELRVLGLGRSSIRLGYTVRTAGAGPEAPPRLTGATVCVVMDLDPQSPGFRAALPMPEDLRAAIEAFGVSPPA
ncbi:MAG: acyl-CoA thioesterase [Myxococcales bacterium]|nr:acyl-CoA thioesterase [Myxococcales bacterium]